jgi:hypothetical protein
MAKVLTEGQKAQLLIQQGGVDGKHKMHEK